MDGRGAAPLGPPISRAARTESKPVRPVSTQLEEVVKVNHAAVLQIIDEAGEHVVRGQWPQSDQPVFNAKFIVGEIISLVEDTSGQSNALERTLADEYYGTTVRQFQGHE